MVHTLSVEEKLSTDLSLLPFHLRRLDYFVLSERLMKDVCNCVVRSEVVGSDHCPLVLSMAMS